MSSCARSPRGAATLQCSGGGALRGVVAPGHLGDINLATPANIAVAMNAAIADGKTGYCAAAGIAPLREALAHDVGSRRGLAYSAANVVVQPGGKPGRPITVA